MDINDGQLASRGCNVQVAALGEGAKRSSHLCTRATDRTVKGLTSMPGSCSGIYDTEQPESKLNQIWIYVGTPLAL